MCFVCGKIYCEPACPAYDAAVDETVCGWCEECGAPLYAVGLTVCGVCEKEKEKQNDGIECRSRKNKSRIAKGGGITTGIDGYG
ncbi:MAG: hypothetical protein J6Q42_01020 [Clostridia bacterium]|nr:hypothetical protein [Clostridia bacterium]